MDGCSSIHLPNIIGCKQQVIGSILVMSPCVISDNRWTPSQRGRLAWLNDHTAGGYYKVLTSHYPFTALLTAKNSSISLCLARHKPVLSINPQTRTAVHAQNLIDDGRQLLTMWNKFQPWRTRVYTITIRPQRAPGICSNP
jgi:hypothetical protein